jgi:1-deoxy-D-xylulose-5-phosphate synthase
MFTCAVQSPGPVFVRYPRGPIPKRPAGRAFEAVVRGKGVVEVKTAGAPHVLVCALGSTVEPSVKAVAILAEKGVRAAVINARFAKPLDEELILSMADGVRAVVTVEENTVVGGFGEAVFDALEQAGRLPARAKKLGLPDEFIAHGDRDRILKELGLDAHGIARAAEKLLS